jgi:hypothetical protein
MRRVIGVGSTLALLAFVAALVFTLTPQPCAPQPAGSRFAVCIPGNTGRVILLGLLAVALSTLTGPLGVCHSLITQRHVFAALMGVGVLAVAVTFALTPLVNGSAALAVALSPLLAIVTLLYSLASSGGQPHGALLDATPANHVQ